ncbi:MAG: ribosome small subunit-dependent GTPase A [Candidatus Glassbacteria bacterium]|nr:ribosome small subunit-dependent GTPase A [Candidatus Glassbacteria bacterium]
MQLENIGFNAWFQERLDSGKSRELQPARVIAINKNSYQVSDGSGPVTAELTGRLMFNADSPLELPAVGDWVYVQIADDRSLAVIHDIFPRKTLLKRKTVGKRVEWQLIAANIDSAMIIQALDADFNLRRLERYLVMVNESNITPVILLSKSDLLHTTEIEAKKTEIRSLMPDIGIIAFSNIDASQVDSVRRVLIPGCTYCLLGSSGVGKTTLINRLVDGELYETRAVREKDGKGRHTTSRRQLISLDNGALIIDTPGMRELGNIAVDSGLEKTFGEIAELTEQCRFNDCSHINEEGCAVLAAVENGTLERERYLSYLKLRRESEYYEASYREKREKDRKFGKYCKSVMKDKKKERG